MNFLKRFSSPGAILGVLGISASVGGIFYFMNDPKLLTYFIIALVSVVLLVAFAFFVRYLMRKSSEKKREQELTGLNVAEKSDEITAKFEEGIRKFKESGKDLYSMPWYAFLGAPGSGKTWAIRKSGMQFPQDLSASVKGHAGTKGMDWWFSDQAVLLDTAGEMTVQEDLEAKIVSDKMWSVFLDKLKKFRPNEPINGVFMTIPADSLLGDSPELIEAKTSQMHERLVSMQKHLSIFHVLFQRRVASGTLVI